MRGVATEACRRRRRDE